MDAIRTHRRPGPAHCGCVTGLALGVAALSLGCATTTGSLEPAPRWSSAALVCPQPAPPIPAEVERGDVEGVVLAEYHVADGGRVDQLRFPYRTGNAPLLEHVAEEWLRSCTAATASAKSDWYRLGFGFHAPYQPDTGYPAPIDWRKPFKEREGYQGPVLVGCAPNEPVFLEDLDASKLDAVIGRDGRVVEVRSAPFQDDPQYLLPTIRFWAQTCRFKPARGPDGEAVAASVPVTLLAHVGEPQRPPSGEVKLLNETLSRPLPGPDCGKPAPSEKILRNRITGTVLVEFVVHSDGHVGEVRLRNPAPTALFNVVRSWLLACPYTPSKNPAGEALPVKIIQPFTFKYSY